MCSGVGNEVTFHPDLWQLAARSELGKGLQSQSLPVSPELVEGRLAPKGVVRQAHH